MIVEDAMVVIHLAKITLLEKSCQYFKDVIISQRVYDEILAGEKRGHSEVKVITSLIEAKKMIVKLVTKKSLIEKAEQFNIQRGEGEAVALYWQEKADYLATDDDNVRKKSTILEIKVIGTPAIILHLYKQRLITKEKFEESISELRKIGWFSDAIIDKILMEK